MYIVFTALKKVYTYKALRLSFCVLLINNELKTGDLMNKKFPYYWIHYIYKLCQWGGLLFFTFLNTYAFGLTPFVDNGNLLRPEKYEISIHTQFVSQKEEIDFNVVAQFDEGFPYRRDINMRYFIGFGEYGFLTGSFLKWIPFPDYRYQPAIGASVGISYNLFNLNTHYVSLYLRPLISKEFGTVVGIFIPYIALPSSIRIKNFSAVQFPVRIAFGIRGELFFIHFHKFDANIEISMDLTKATPSYFGIGLITSWM